MTKLHIKHKWFFQEWWTEWTLWGLGFIFTGHGGWSYDELTIYIGPLRLHYLCAARMNEQYDEEAP